MVALRRTKSGLWTARKVIPSGVREANGKREEKTSWPADLPQGQAKAELAAWLTPIEERIERLKGLATQTPVTLSQRQCRALAGEWYKAQVALHEEEPGQAIDWDIVQGELIPDDPAAREAERLQPTPWLTEERDNLLRERMLHLQPSSAESLLQEMAGVFWNLCDLMQRRAGGDYGADPLIASLPELQETPEAVVSITDLFEGFANTGAMAEHTVGKWRSAIRSFVEHVGHDNAMSVKRSDAHAWFGALQAKGLTVATVRNSSQMWDGQASQETPPSSRLTG